MQPSSPGRTLHRPDRHRPRTVAAIAASSPPRSFLSPRTFAVIRQESRLASRGGERRPESSVHLRVSTAAAPHLLGPWWHHLRHPRTARHRHLGIALPLEAVIVDLLRYP